MTLTEYKNQKDPVKHPNVYLQEGEFKIWGASPISGDRRGKALCRVTVSDYPYQYVAFVGKRPIYTIDKDGNPKARSVFILPKKIQSNG